MEINAAAKEYRNGIITSFKKNRRMLLMMLLFAAGMIFGAASVKKSDSYFFGAFSDMFSVYIRSKGWVNQAVSFKGDTWTLMDPTFDSNSDDKEAIQDYIGDESNYTVQFTR